MLVNPKEIEGTKFVLGSLNDEYRTVNKIVHYNLRTRGLEKNLGMNKIMFLHHVLIERVFDFAKIIWAVIVNFCTVTNITSQMPFHDISILC